MINLFLDSNIWLDLYYYSNDDVEQFNKLYDMLDKDVKLFIPQQVVDEVNRNRENKIKDALKTFKDICFKFPNLCKGYGAYQTLQIVYKNFKQIHGEVSRQIEKDINDENLIADQSIKKFFSHVEIISVDSSIVDKAVLRYKLGNPPGKENSYGDAVNWITLLEKVPSGEDLFFVSSDKDYRSTLNDHKLNNFLAHEWENTKKSQLFFYTSLTSFLNEHIKDIRLKTETEKSNLIEQLRNSGYFETTHKIVQKLEDYSHWSDDQVIQLFAAADYNNQVYAIIRDNDIERFFLRLYNEHSETINKHEEFTWLLEKLGIEIQPADREDNSET